MRAPGPFRNSWLTVQIYKSRCILLSRHAQLDLCALGPVRIWHVRIVLSLTIMQRYRCSTCHLTATGCLNNVAANIRKFPFLEKRS